MKTRRTKLPDALAAADKAFGKVEQEIEEIVRGMQRWDCVRREVLDWANSLTSGNCGWTEYGLAQLILQRDRARQK